MGLDMYAKAVPAEFATGQVDVNLNAAYEAGKIEDLHYWRKHHDLHGWMEQLYCSKGGADSNFNCNTVQLTSEDLDALVTALEQQGLPHTTGFFFGNNPPDADTLADDLEFVAKARAAIAEGKAIFYNSWW